MNLAVKREIQQTSADYEERRKVVARVPCFALILVLLLVTAEQGERGVWGRKWLRVLPSETAHSTAWGLGLVLLLI